MKKKALAILLTAAMISSLTACGSSSSSSTATSTAAEATSTAAATETADAAESTADAAAAETTETAIPVHEAKYEGTAHSATKKHDEINIAMDVDPGNLSPEAVSDSGGAMWKWNVYEHLFDINGLGGDLIPAVAESYEQIDDTTYRVHLFEGVKDSDGNELHASDVIYAYDTLIAAGNRMSGDIARDRTLPDVPESLLEGPDKVRKRCSLFQRREPR